MELYCFSATGNTLSTARLIREYVNEECRIISMAGLIDSAKIIPGDNSIGYLFPIYNGDMPYIVRDIISKTEFPDDSYIFSVCTYRGYCGAIDSRLDHLLSEHGQRLSLSLGIRMPGNSRLSTADETNEALSNQKENVMRIADRIESRECVDYSGLPLPTPSPFTEGYGNTRGITSDDTCIGCGICEQICPTGNIKLLEAHPVFGEKCTTCLACFHWCPVESIYMSKSPDISRRSKYHHPDITLDDILSLKNQRQR